MHGKGLKIRHLTFLLEMEVHGLKILYGAIIVTLFLINELYNSGETQIVIRL